MSMQSSCVYCVDGQRVEEGEVKNRYTYEKEKKDGVRIMVSI